MKYTVKEVSSRFGDHKDWVSLTFEEHNNEPVIMQEPDEIKVGQVFEGRIGTTKKGRPLFIKQTPYQLERRQADIMAQWAVRLGYEHAADHTNSEEVYAIADNAFTLALRLAEEKADV